MIGLDTNILVRFLTHDDPDQYKSAKAFMADLSPENPGYVSREVVVELAWVLQSSFRQGRQQIAETFEGLLGSKELVFEAGEAMAVAIEDYATGGPGLADHMIREAARLAGCTHLATFDRKLGRMAYVTLLA